MEMDDIDVSHRNSKVSEYANHVRESALSQSGKQKSSLRNLMGMVSTQERAKLYSAVEDDKARNPLHIAGSLTMGYSHHSRQAEHQVSL